MWALVTTRPSSSSTKPEPVETPSSRRVSAWKALAPGWTVLALIETTEGAARSYSSAAVNRSPESSASRPCWRPTPPLPLLPTSIPAAVTAPPSRAATIGTASCRRVMRV
jgi:hypothetical protein